jgi:hypothetical protein
MQIFEQVFEVWRQVVDSRKVAEKLHVNGRYLLDRQILDVN